MAAPIYALIYLTIVGESQHDKNSPTPKFTQYYHANKVHIFELVIKYTIIYATVSH